MTTCRQCGFTLIQAALVMALMSYVSTLAIPLLGDWRRAKAVSNTRHGFEQLAQAAVAYRADESQSWYGTWPATPATLVPRYLPIFNDANGRGQPYTFSVSGTGLTISTTMNSLIEARLVASNWSSVASVTAKTVTLAIAIPGQESSHSQLLDRAGVRSVQATMEYDPGADIALQDNDIWGANRITATNRVTVTNASGTALIDADVVNGSAMSATTFRYQ